MSLFGADYSSLNLVTPSGPHRFSTPTHCLLHCRSCSILLKTLGTYGSKVLGTFGTVHELLSTVRMILLVRCSTGIAIYMVLLYPWLYHVIPGFWHVWMLGNWESWNRLNSPAMEAAWTPEVIVERAAEARENDHERISAEWQRCSHPGGCGWLRLSLAMTKQENHH